MAAVRADQVAYGSMRMVRVACLAAATHVLGACGSSDRSNAAGSPADTLFGSAPLDLAAIDVINPLGHMTTPFNALPQPRMYLVLRDRLQNNRVYAPAAGVVKSIVPPDAQRVDSRIDVGVGFTLTYFFDHIALDAGIQVGSRVEAGQRIARHGGNSCCVDFGLVNTGVTNFYANPLRYSGASINADSPLRHFSEPVRSLLYAKVLRVTADKDGRAHYDVAGRLVGGWFHEDQLVEGSQLPAAWPKQLAFAYSNTHPGMVLISVAGTLALTNLFATEDTAPDPATVSQSSGLVSYRLFQKNPPVSEGNQKASTQLGVMLVQMLAEDRIRVEIFPGSSTTLPSAFSAQSKVYVR